MQPRLIVAYLLILLIALSVAAFVAFLLYNTHSRQRRRRYRRDAVKRDRLAAFSLADAADRRHD